jgi:alpha-D-ribose 1-methylphosphonate 5-triphosphate synthase subunit PhnH
MRAAAETVDGGFADPVFDAQSVFRAVMDAMARPGDTRPVRVIAAPPAPLAATAAAVALTLCDHDTALWLDPTLAASDAVRSWLAFHTGAPLVDAPADAAFALVADPDGLGSFAEFAQGSQEYPDRSTTLILQVSSIAGAGPTPTSASTLLLEGPGIETTAQLAISPLPASFLSDWQDNRARFPRGVDVILAAPGAVACLPRTVKIREA